MWATANARCHEARPATSCARRPDAARRAEPRRGGDNSGHRPAAGAGCSARGPAARLRHPSPHQLPGPSFRGQSQACARRVKAGFAACVLSAWRRPALPCVACRWAWHCGEAEICPFHAMSYEGPAQGVVVIHEASACGTIAGSLVPAFPQHPQTLGTVRSCGFYLALGGCCSVDAYRQLETPP